MKRTREVLRGIDAALLDNDRMLIEERVERVLASASLPFIHDHGPERHPDCYRNRCDQATLWKGHGAPLVALTTADFTQEAAEIFPDLYGGWVYREPPRPGPLQHAAVPPRSPT